MINSLVLERNIFLFFPFVLFFFSHKFLLYLKRYFLIIIFVTVPLGFSIFLFHNVGNNFFRVFYHGYFIVILFSLLFLFAEIKKNDISQILIFISPLFFLIDFIYIFNNINQDGFFNFFQVTRYQFLSGYFFFNIIIILVLVMNLKNLFIRISNKKYEK